MENGKITFYEALMQGLSSAGPVLNLVALFPIVLGIMGHWSFLALMLSTLVGAFTVFTGYSFSRVMSTNGGYYSYVGRTFGKGAGIFTAILYLTYSFMAFPSIVLFLNFFVDTFVPAHLSGNLFFNVGFSSVISLYLILIVFRGLRITMRYILVSGIIEIGFIIGLSVFMALSGTPHNVLKYSFSSNSLFSALPFGILAFAGIGSSIFLSENTKDWKRNTHRSVLYAYLLLSALMLAPVFIISVFFSSAGIAAFTVNPLSLFYGLPSSLGLFGELLFSVIAINSALNLSVAYLNAFRNSFTKVLEDGIIIAVKGTRTTLRMVAVTIMVITITLSAIANLTQDLYYYFIVVTGIVSILFLTVHTISNFALIRYLKLAGSYLSMPIPMVSILSFAFIIFESIILSNSVAHTSAVISIMLIFIAFCIVLFVRVRTGKYYSDINFNVEM